MTHFGPHWAVKEIFKMKPGNLFYFLPSESVKTNDATAAEMTLNLKSSIRRRQSCLELAMLVDLFRSPKST